MAKVSKSRVFNKIKKNAKGAWKTAREKAPEVKGAKLPGGIIKGVAQFVGYKFDETRDKKTPYLTIQFVVLEPEEFEGVKQSLRYYFSTTKFRKIEEVFDQLSSDLQLMGCETEGTDIDDWEEMLEQCKSEGTTIYYNTRSGTTDDGNEWMKFDIQGLAEDYEGESVDTGEDDDDESGDDEEPEEPEEPEDDESGDDDEPDDDENEDDEDESGDDDEPDDDENEDDEDESGEDDEWYPEDEDVYYYRASKRGKYQQCQVFNVDEDNRTCSLKRLTDGKKFHNISWDKLMGEDEI